MFYYLIIDKLLEFCKLYSKLLSMNYRLKLSFKVLKPTMQTLSREEDKACNIIRNMLHFKILDYPS